MRRNRRPQPPDSHRSPRTGEPDLPSLIELERFTQASLRHWLAAKTNLDALQRTLYFELEALRQRNQAPLLDALRSQVLSSFSFEGWSRIVDYRYGLRPLSLAGSLKGDGGRFNIGGDLSPGTIRAVMSVDRASGTLCDGLPKKSSLGFGPFRADTRFFPGLITPPDP